MGDIINKLLYNIYCSILLFTSTLYSQENPDSTADISNFIVIFLVLLASIFASYKLYIYLKKRKKHIKTQDTFSADQPLLDEGKNLISFLKRNSAENDITIETYRVQNLLNEVYGLIESSVQEKNIEFIYDIDSTMPIELVGDSLRIEQILYNLLSHIIALSNNETITVSFVKSNDPDKIIIQVHNSKKVYIDTSIVNIIQSQLKQLDANLSLEDDIYTIHLPFLKSQLYIEAHYSLPKSVEGQKVLLIEDNIRTAQTISKIFEQLKLEVTTEKTNKLSQIQDFSLYDIIIVDAKLLTPIMLRHFEEIKEKKVFHILSLETLYGQRDRRFKPSPLISKYLYKPLSRGMVYGFLYEISVIHHNESITVTQNKKEDTKVLFIEEKPNITRECFQDFNDAHILVVEDNKINQKIIQSVLEKSNILITIANNGQEALNYLDTDLSIDIVLMDINMPIMDGYQATKHIRQNSSLSSLPIIIVSTLGFRNEIDQMYLAGANAHLTKPFKIGQLYSALNIFLNEKVSEDISRTPIESQYTVDNNILNTEKGTHSVKNILTYRDILRETLILLKNSDEIIKEHIIKKDFSSLQTYCKNIAADSEYIGATGLTQVLQEMLILLQNNEEALLQKYIILYRLSWIKTRRAIELYLKSVHMYE